MTGLERLARALDELDRMMCRGVTESELEAQQQEVRESEREAAREGVQAADNGSTRVYWY